MFQKVCVLQAGRRPTQLGSGGACNSKLRASFILPVLTTTQLHYTIVYPRFKNPHGSHTVGLSAAAFQTALNRKIEIGAI